MHPASTLLTAGLLLGGFAVVRAAPAPSVATPPGENSIWRGPAPSDVSWFCPDPKPDDAQ